MTGDRDPRRALPPVDQVLNEPTMAALRVRYGHTAARAAARDELASWRARWPAGAAAPSAADIAAACAQRLDASRRPSLRPVINLSGTVIHTNLGRAPLPQCALDAVTQAMKAPVNLEFDLATGRRGERDRHVEALLAGLAGAEAALVVNNNAAAVHLALDALARDREVIVSRGELIEIGGGFRVPEIITRAGARLVEVGTTNRTHLRDYEAAISPATAALLKVHPSNYRITGFTASVDEAQLAPLARSHGLALVSDLGSGALLDLRRFGLPYEPTPADMIARGVDLVTFSGDKLLGGPQAGLVAGSAARLDPLRRHPMKRAFRAGKMTLAALEAVLRLYQTPERLITELPVLRLLTRPVDEIRAQALRLAPAVQAALGARVAVSAVPVVSAIGSGALPGATIPSHGLRIRARENAAGPDAAALARAFRALPAPVVGRLHDGALLLDLRCLDAQEGEFVAQLGQLQAEMQAEVAR